MKYYKLSKQGSTIDQILNAFNQWDFNMFNTVQEYVTSQIEAKKSFNEIILQKLDPAEAPIWLTPVAEGTEEGYLQVKTVGFNGGIIFKNSDSHCITYYHNATKTLELTDIDYGDMSIWHSYLAFPKDKGTSEAPAIIATTDNCTKLYKHTFSNVSSTGPTIEYIINAVSQPYDFTGEAAPISTIGNDALKIVVGGAIALGISQTDFFKGSLTIISGTVISNWTLTFNYNGSTTIDTVTPL